MRLSILCLPLLLAACGDHPAENSVASDPQSTASADEIRIYEVTPERRDVAIQTLQRMGAKSVTAIDADTLAVLGTAQEHVAMSELLAAINKPATATTESPPTVGVLKLWQLDEVPTGAEASPVPEMLSGPTRAIHSQFGDLGLQLSDSIAVSFSADRLDAEASSGRLRVSLFDDVGNLGIKVFAKGLGRSGISTVVPLRWDEFIVLSQVTVADDASNPANSYRTFLVVQLVRSDEP